jgi:hypothetical protein
MEKRPHISTLGQQNGVEGVTNQLNPAQTQFPGKSSPLSVKRPVSEDRPESEKLRSDT